MQFSIQPVLENETIRLSPLLADDFNDLYSVACDPEIWEQHPEKERWKEDIFSQYFETAIQSKGAFKVIDKTKNIIIGSTRFYNFNPSENSILIGFTFYGKSYWGKGTNQAVKKLMLDYIFEFVETVCFHIGSENIPSQMAIVRLGAKKIREEETEKGKKLVYAISKNEWLNGNTSIAKSV
jgi:RimJ/RimL family protein N-acetyltransferase